MPNAQFAILQVMLYGRAQQSAEECVQRLSFGGYLITHASSVCLLVIPVLE
jgi:hypothetical protein